MDLAKMLTDMVPFIGTVGLVFDHIGPGEARAVLPYRPAVGNHIGTAHAGAVYTLGESASGGVVLSLFADQLPLGGFIALKGSQVTHTKAAPGDVVATARLTGDAHAVRSAYDESGRVDFDVEVVMTVGAVETARVTYTWAVRAPRS
ncbi:MAG: DUF4442 domain-containing protein [Myxococcota bacterium]|nr:DUF4442 domain-containing protein [Myxococcota bacterium]MEC8422761.1 DUF4442 domain-containing protein [Myxococcota bacterium]